MGGLFLDLYIGYVFRTIALWLKFPGSDRWPKVNAVITGQPTVSSSTWGDIVDIAYEYRVDGEPYTGFHEEPFVFSNSAREFADGLIRGGNVIIRVKPARPEISTLRAKD